MAFVKFRESQDVHKVNISHSGNNLLRLYPPLPEVELTAGFHVLTKEKGGKVFGDYTAYTTIYRKMEDGSIILSNDGSVWVEPVYKISFSVSNASVIGTTEQVARDFGELEIPTVIADDNYEFTEWVPEVPQKGKIEQDMVFVAKMQYIPTLDEVKSEKKREISAACEQIIHDGVDVEVDDMTEHFSLSTNDQLNLFGKQAQIAAGEVQFEYHQDGHPCKYYDLTSMQKIINAAMAHVSYHTTYCNSLNMWIAGATTKEEVARIYYGATVPEEYQSEVLKTYLYSL